jgi:hypothetical protein
MVGEVLFSLLQEDLSNKPVVVKVGDGNAARQIILNEPIQDEEGNRILKNDVSRVKPKIVLDDIKSTPTYRMQAMTQLAEITKSLPPQAQGALADLWVEASDLPGKQRVIDRLRTALNLPDDSPDGRKQAAAAAQEQQQMQQQQMQLAMAEQQAKIEQLQAMTAKLMAEAEAVGAETADGGAGVVAAQSEAMKEQQAMQSAINALEQTIAQLKLAAASKQEELAQKRTESLIDARTKIAAAHIGAKTQLETAKIAAAAQVQVAKSKPAPKPAAKK